MCILLTSCSYLTKVEERVRRLESLICDILPNADIDKLLSKSREPRRRFANINQDDYDGIKIEPTEDAPSLEPQPPAHRPLLPNDEVPDEADGFDWIEEELKGNELTDGMAALSINPQGTGYFGLASSSVLLRALRISSWDIPLTPEDEDDTEYRTRENLYTIASTPMPKIISDSLVDAFFLYYNSSYPIIHEQTYRAQYAGLIPRPREDVWELLHNAVQALGSWCICNEKKGADLIYYRQARSKLNSSILETGSLHLVQALTLLSNYVQKRNKPNTGWNYLGLAIRMALGLGLYREFPSWKSSPLKLEMRRRVWWVLYIFDAGAAVTFGRPINLPGPEIVDVKLPMNVHDENLTADTVEMPSPITGPTIYSGLIAQSKFCLLTNGIYNRLISKPSPSAEESLEFNKSIEKLMSELPEYFQENGPIDTSRQWFVLTRYRLLWRVKNFQVIMFRPFILQRVLLVGDNRQRLPPDLTNSQAEQECRRICIRSARETIGLVHEFLDQFQHSSISNWYALYFLFQASLIPIISLSAEPNAADAPAWLQDVAHTKEILLSLTAQNCLAARFYDVIERLSQQFLQPAYGNTAIEPMPMNFRNEWMSDIYSLVFDFSKPPNGLDENSLPPGFGMPNDDPIIM